MTSLKRWRFAGIVVLTVLGFVLHYLFSWTGGSKIVGFYSPVNESVWEHLKLGYWSVVLFSVVEHLSIKNRTNNYFLARTIGILTLEVTIIIIFYWYTFIAGKDILLIDISSYILAVISCQYITYFFLRAQPFSKAINRICLAIFLLLGVLFGAMTYYPPHIAIFKDSIKNTYGIGREK